MRLYYVQNDFRVLAFAGRSIRDSYVSLYSDESNSIRRITRAEAERLSPTFTYMRDHSHVMDAKVRFSKIDA